MRLIKLNSTPLDLSVIPAKLHDTANEVHDDKLYSLYTVSTTVEGSLIKVDIIAGDLVEHTAGNGMKGFWVGIGIPSSLIDGANVYVGWKQSNLSNSEPDGQQLVNDKLYYTYYFNAKAAEKYNNTAHLVVEKEGLRYYYVLNFSKVEKRESIDPLEEIRWGEVSLSTIKNHYLFGINLTDPKGNPLPDSLFIHYINSAVDYLENLLDITITPKDFTDERHDYIQNDYRNWGFIQLQHCPVRTITELVLMYGGQKSIQIPLDWIQLNKLTGQITLFPSAGSANSLIIGQTGLLFGFQSQWSYAPMLWSVTYNAGIDENDPSMPLDLLKECIFKRACCGILNVWGDLVLGAGIASQSVSIDGISQSIGTTQSAEFGAASARINTYTKDIQDNLLPVLRQKLGGIRLIVV